MVKKSSSPSKAVLVIQKEEKSAEGLNFVEEGKVEEEPQDCQLAVALCSEGPWGVPISFAAYFHQDAVRRVEGPSLRRNHASKRPPSMLSPAVRAQNKFYQWIGHEVQGVGHGRVPQVQVL